EPQAQLRLGRRRLDRPSVGRAVRGAGRARLGPYSFPRRRAGDDRPSRRPDRHVLRQCLPDRPARAGRQGPDPRGRRRGAHAAAPAGADHQRGLSELLAVLVERLSGAGGHPAADHRPALPADDRRRPRCRDRRPADQARRDAQRHHARGVCRTDRARAAAVRRGDRGRWTATQVARRLRSDRWTQRRRGATTRALGGGRRAGQETSQETRRGSEAMDIKVGKQAIGAATEKLRNWGRWGKDDQIGTLNHVRPEDIVKAASLIRTGKGFALGIPLDANGPQTGLFGGRFNPIHQMLATGTDAIAERQDWNKIRYADDTLMLCVQGATHWDALGHIFYEDKAYNGYDAKLIDA